MKAQLSTGQQGNRRPKWLGTRPVEDHERKKRADPDGSAGIGITGPSLFVHRRRLANGFHPKNSRRSSGLLGLVANLAPDTTTDQHATLRAALGLAGFDELGTGTVDHDNNLT